MISIDGLDGPLDFEVDDDDFDMEIDLGVRNLFWVPP